MVHLKTVDSVALPIYHSLPPEAKLLAPLGEGPVEKRVKLSSLDVDEEEEEENVGELQTLGQEEGGGERKVSTAAVSTPPPLEQKKKVCFLPLYIFVIKMEMLGLKASMYAHFLPDTIQLQVR